MANERMERRASDNQYLHKDFHGSLSIGLDYLAEKYGEESVREYLNQFAVAYYAPLIQDLNARGLIALKEHFERIYAIEGGCIDIHFTEDELVLRIEACPAVMHLRAQDYPVSKFFYETSRTLNHALCQGTPFASELIEYDEQTGQSVQRFYRRTK